MRLCSISSFSKRAGSFPNLDSSPLLRDLLLRMTYLIPFYNFSTARPFGLRSGFAKSLADNSSFFMIASTKLSSNYVLILPESKSFLSKLLVCFNMSIVGNSLSSSSLEIFLRSGLTLPIWRGDYYLCSKHLNLKPLTTICAGL